MDGAKTRHIVLTVTAHIVDVYDSDTEEDPATGHRPPDELSKPAVSIDTRPCYDCVGIPLSKGGHADADESAAVRSCLDDVNSVLKSMLSDAATTILTQSKAWTSIKHPRGR